MSDTIGKVTFTLCMLSMTIFVGAAASAAQGPDPVTVVNTPLPVQIVTNPADLPTPVAFELADTFPHNVFTVPLGKRLTIEYISAICGASNDPGAVVAGFPPTPPFVAFSATTGGVTNSHKLTLPFNPIPYDPSRAQNNILQWNIGHSVKVYADPGTAVISVSPTCVMTFSGLLTTAP